MGLRGEWMDGWMHACMHELWPSPCKMISFLSNPSVLHQQFLMESSCSQIIRFTLQYWWSSCSTFFFFFPFSWNSSFFWAGTTSYLIWIDLIYLHGEVTAQQAKNPQLELMMINFWISSFLSKLALDSSTSLGPQVVLRSLSSPSSSCTGDPPPLVFPGIISVWWVGTESLLVDLQGQIHFQPAWIPSVTNWWWCQPSADKLFPSSLDLTFQTHNLCSTGSQVVHKSCDKSPSNSRWSFSSSLPGIQFLWVGTAL